MRYSLRTLLVLLVVSPPLVAGAWWAVVAYRAPLAASDEWVDVAGPGSISVFEINCTFSVDAESADGAGPETILSSEIEVIEEQ